MYKPFRNVISPMSVITVIQVILLQSLIPLPGGSSWSHQVAIKQLWINYDTLTSIGP